VEPFRVAQPDGRASGLPSGIVRVDAARFELDRFDRGLERRGGIAAQEVDERGFAAEPGVHRELLRSFDPRRHRVEPLACRADISSMRLEKDLAELARELVLRTEFTPLEAVERLLGLVPSAQLDGPLRCVGQPWFNPNLITLYESTDPKKIRKFREKLAKRAAERGDLAPEALEEWGYLIRERSTEPSGS
jgi:hypothetical protein